MSLELEIPVEDFNSLIELSNMSLADFKMLMIQIENIKLNDSFVEVENQLKDITNHYKLILGLYFTFCKFDIPEEKFTNKLYDYYVKKINSNTNKKTFTEKFLLLFRKNNPIRVTIKSFIISSQVDKAYNEARIITDIRPVFSSKEEHEIINQLIINNLKITYSDGEDTKDFFVSLDIDDLFSLKATIERAINKTNLLKTIYKYGKD